MLITASSLGYTPATILVMSLLAHTPSDDFRKARPTFRDTEARFTRVLQTEQNPDAFTVQGLILQKAGRPDAEALKYFDKAIAAAAAEAEAEPTQAGTTTPAATAVRSPRWAHEGLCHQQRGLILLRQNRPADALSSFEIVALELDLADGHVELAKLLPADVPQRETSLLKAAQAGSFEAAGLYAVLLADKAAAADSGLAKSERDVLARMAWEWTQVDPDAAKRAEFEAQVAERVAGTQNGS